MSSADFKGEIDLFAGDILTVRCFAARIITLANEDFKKGRKSPRSADYLIDHCLVSQSRRLHNKMATSLYNNARRTLELARMEREKSL